MSATPSVSVVIPARNGESTLGDCLASVLSGDFPAERREIIVVDNGSTDRTAEIAHRFGVRCVPEPHRGLSHARNRGVTASTGDVVVFLDCDCLATTGWLRQLVAGFDDGVAVVAGAVLAYPPSTAAERYTAIRKADWLGWVSNRDVTPWLLGGNAAVRREVFERVGLFDTSFFVACEDIDFVWRLVSAGFEFGRCPEAVVLHRHRGTVRGLFRQNVGYGRSQTVLVRRWPDRLSWGVREELQAWSDLAVSAGRVVRAYVRRRHDRGLGGFEYAYLDLVRKVAQRVGYLDGLARGRGG